MAKASPKPFKPTAKIPAPHPKSQKARPEKKTRSPEPDPHNTDEANKIRIARLEAENEVYRALGAALVKERADLKAKISVLEAKLREAEHKAAAEPHGSGSDRRYKALKQLIAREFHPDQVQGEGFEKDVREVLFKRICPMIERIERGG